MSNRAIYVGARGTGKTKWLIEQLFNEVNTNSNRYFIYCGSKESYDKICKKYMSLTHTRCPLRHIEEAWRFTGLNSENTVCFTDGLFNTRIIASEELKDRQIKWYITMDAEDFVNA